MFVTRGRREPQVRLEPQPRRLADEDAALERRRTIAPPTYHLELFLQRTVLHGSVIVRIKLIKAEVYQVAQFREGIIHKSKDRLTGERE
jgi:hypothetical protein